MNEAWPSVDGWRFAVQIERHPYMEAAHSRRVKGTHSPTGFMQFVQIGIPGFWQHHEGWHTRCEQDIATALALAEQTALAYNEKGLDCGAVFWKPGDHTPYGLKAWLASE